MKGVKWGGKAGLKYSVHWSRCCHVLLHSQSWYLLVPWAERAYIWKILIHPSRLQLLTIWPRQVALALGREARFRNMKHKGGIWRLGFSVRLQFVPIIISKGGINQVALFRTFAYRHHPDQAPEGALLDQISFSMDRDHPVPSTEVLLAACSVRQRAGAESQVAPNIWGKPVTTAIEANRSNSLHPERATFQKTKKCLQDER